VNYGDTNNVVQAKIARLVNSSNVGLSASVIRDGKGNTALQLVSKNTGLSDDENELFSIQSGSSWNEVKKLGIANTSQSASNSEFTLNGSLHSSLANTFTINRDFEITLLGTTPEDTPARIGFKANTEAIADSVEDLITSYNGFIAVGEKYRGKHANNQLLNEVHGISRNRAEDLSSIGIEENEDGTLTLDRKKLASAVGPADAKRTFKILNRFKEDLSKEANKTSVNPLNYVDKVTVEYKDPKNVFTAPYASSVYSGLLLDLSL
jgi:flagellar hook-associated protein 2